MQTFPIHATDAPEPMGGDNPVLDVHGVQRRLLVISGQIAADAQREVPSELRAIAAA
jgi:hypothetical protein